MFYIRQGATHKVVVGPAVAVGDGFTPVTALDVSTADEAEAILHDNGTVVDISGYTWAAIATADGYYHLTLHADISGTCGHMTVVVNDDNVCLPLRADFTIVEEAVYDAFFKAAAVGIPAIPADWITAAGIAAAAIDNATFAADVGSTAYATNIIALAVRKVLDEIKLDHLVAVADADDVVNDSIVGKLASTDGDWSNFSDTTDSLQSIRDVAPHGSAMVGTDGANTVVPDAAGTASALHTITNAAVGGVAAAVWGVGTRTLTSFGTLVADAATAVWSAAARTLTAFGFTVVTDAASRTASKATGFAVAGDAMNLAADAITAAKIADDALAAEHIATGAFTADAFAAASIEAGAFAVDAMTRITANVVDGLKDDSQWKHILGAAKGKHVWDNTAKTLKVYGTDNTTLLYTLTLSATGRTVA